MPIIDNAIYVDGERRVTPDTLSETFERRQAEGGFAWIGLYHPTDAELDAVADEFGLHPLAVEDARKGHQRAKIEHYGDVLFLVLRPGRYVSDDDRVEFGELHVFVGAEFIITIRRSENPDLAQVRHRMEQQIDLLRLGAPAVLYAILDQVVDEYGPLLVALADDVDDVEDRLFTSHDPQIARRLYELARETAALQRSTHPLRDMLEFLHEAYQARDFSLELLRHLRDVQDHTLLIMERADAIRDLLQNALITHSTLVTQRQNEETVQVGQQTKKISSWAAILFGPTLIPTVYGMNFEIMPELKWEWGYPFALSLMVLSGAGLYVVFKRRGWL